MNPQEFLESIQGLKMHEAVADETLFRQINNLLIEAREDELRKLVLAKNHFFTITVSDKTFIELTSKHIDDRLAQLKAQKGDS